MNAVVAIEIGNTSIKSGWVADSSHWPPSWIQRTESVTDSEEQPEFFADLPDAPVQWWIASVHREAERRLREWIHQSRPTDSVESVTYRHVPIALNLAEPAHVGIDRILGAYTARRIVTGQRPIIVVDAGTAITVDMIDEHGCFQGGAILPGIGLVAHALAENTDRLPQIQHRFDDGPPDPLGRATEPAMRSGLFYGAVGAIKEVVARISAELEMAPDIVVTGGDARTLTPWIGPAAFYQEDLVLAGIVGVAQTIAMTEQ